MQPNSFARLLAIAQRALTFTAAGGQAFVRLPVASSGGYILPVRPPAFRNWFLHEFYAQYDTFPSSHAFHAVLNHLEAEANYNERNQRLSVFRRVGCRGPSLAPEQILLDLANSDSQFAEISPTGWKVTAGPGVLLQTSRSIFSLPAPVQCPPGPLCDEPAPSFTGHGPWPTRFGEPGPRPLADADPRRQWHRIEIPALTWRWQGHRHPRGSLCRIFRKKPSRCDTKPRPASATHRNRGT